MSNFILVNGNYQNNVLTIATCIANVINVCCYCAFAGLVLGLSYFKVETRGGLSNLVTRSRAHVRVSVERVGEVVHASREQFHFRRSTYVVCVCGRQCSSLRCLELMVEAVCSGRSQWLWQHSCMWVGVPPMPVLG
jgi:hypothetical protein